MNVGIICGYPIPYGMAATTRIFSYSQGLIKCGDSVDVWSITPTNFAGKQNTNTKGVFRGISYFYSYRCKRFENKILHILEMIWSLCVLGFRLAGRNRVFKYDTFIVSSDSICVLTYMAFVGLWLKKKLVFIFDEYPIPIRGKCKNEIPTWKRNVYKFILKYYSGYVSMTNNLLEYYRQLVNKPGIVISSIIDTSRFDKIVKSRHCGGEYKIVYMGNMELSKDNVDNILYAFSILLCRKYKVELYLYGKPNAKDKKILENIIVNEKLEGKVHFCYASFDDVPEILSNADILVSSQPVTIRAAGGFPTKLGEYLISGTPTLLTDVGETSQYFKDNVHMFFAKPLSPIDFAEKLIYIIENYDNSLLVAENGKNLIMQMYSHISAGQKLHDFLKQL